MVRYSSHDLTNRLKVRYSSHGFKKEILNDNGLPTSIKSVIQKVFDRYIDCYFKVTIMLSEVRQSLSLFDSPCLD